MVASLASRLSRLLAVPGLAAGGLLAALSGGAASGPVTAVFPPWWDATRAVEAAAAGGAVLRLGGTGFAVLVAPDGTSGRERLRRAGAWLLLDPGGLAGCGFLSK
jgi:hypothetical protein